MAKEKMNLDGMIAAVEAQISAFQEALSSLKKAKESLGGIHISQTIKGGVIGPDTFTGHTIASAVEKYLRMKGQPARTTQEITEALKDGGFRNPSRSSVASILNRVDQANGPVAKIKKGYWGLAEWYPNRPSRTKREKNEEIKKEGKEEKSTE